MRRCGRRVAASRWIGLWAVALAIRALALEVAVPVGLVGDEIYYVETAVQIASGSGHYNPTLGAHAAWPPAQAWLLSHFVDTRQPPRTRDAASLETLQRVGVVLGSILPLLVVLLGQALFNERAGWIAGSIAAIYPEFVSYSQFLWAENLFMVLLTTALWLAVRARTGGIAWVVAAGACFGAATLTREEGLLVAAACGLWWAGWTSTPPTGTRRAMVLLAVAVAIVAPWSVRNYLVLNRIVPVSLSGWMGAMEGNLPGQPWLRSDMTIVREWRRRYNAIPDESERLDFARTVALRSITAEQPSWIAKKLARNLPPMLAPDSFVLKKVTQGAYGDVSLCWRRVILVVTAVTYLAIAPLALVGIAAADPMRRSLPLLVGGAIFALHLVANASSRYRLPLMPLAIVYASHAVSLRGRTISGLGARARLSVGLGGLLLAASLALFLPDAADFWTRGTFVEGLRP